MDLFAVLQTMDYLTLQDSREEQNMTTLDYNCLCKGG